MSSPEAEAALVDWILTQGLGSGDGTGIVSGAASRLVEAGVPLWRLYVALPMVSRNFRSISLEWRSDRGEVFEGIRHDTGPEDFDVSPFRAMLEAETNTRRWRLGPDVAPSGFPVLDRIGQEGARDHVVHLVSFDETGTRAMRGAAIAFSTDDPAGFETRHIELFARVVPILGLTTLRIALSHLVRTLLNCYVGRLAGERVLRGEIQRGIGMTTSAAILFADLRGFTSASETGGAGLVERLGRHLEAIAIPIERAGGEILKIMGDGLLAAFTDDAAGGRTGACTAAVEAALEALEGNRLVTADETVPLHVGVAIHWGEVFYGNIGAGSRLDFTVIGPAVNLASRLEGLCGVLGRNLLLSGDVARHCGRPVVSLGSHTLRGIAAAREVFTLADATAGAAPAREAARSAQDA